MNKVLGAIIITLIVTICSCSHNNTSSGKDLIIVLDTSMSMVGKGGKNILPQVKDSLNRFVDKLETGDSFTFITFDETTKVYPTVDINNISKTDVLKKYISMVEANGMWTYTMDMLASVVGKGREINTANPNRKMMIVVLTDGLDDPPPSVKRKQINIKDIAKGDTSEWYVFFVNLGDASDNAKFKALNDLISKNITKHTAVINSMGDVKTAIEDKLKDKLNNANNNGKRSVIVKIIPIIIPLFILLAVCVLYFIRKSSLKVAGLINYRPEDNKKAMFETVDLSIFKSSIVTAGRNSTDNIQLKDFKGSKSLIMKAVRLNDEVKIVFDEEKGTRVKFVRDKKEIFLVNGDEFTAGGYLFVYRETE